MSSEIWKKPWPYIALLIAHIIWGANFVVAKITLQEIPMMNLSFLRFFIATLLLLPFVLSIKKQKVETRDMTRIILVGLCMATFNIAFFYAGIKRTLAIDASVLSMIIPILSVLGGWWFLKEKIYWVNLFGIGLSLLGALLVIGLPLLLLGVSGDSDLFGNSMIIISCVFFVIGAILSKPLINKYHPIFMTFAIFLVAAVSFVIPAFLELRHNSDWVNNLTVLGILGFWFITLLSSIVAFFLQNYGYEKVGVTQSNMFHYIEPAVAATMAVFFLNERISFSFIVGTTLIILGVYWGTLGKDAHHHSLHKSKRM